GSHVVDLLLSFKPREIVVIDNLLRGKKENLKCALDVSSLPSSNTKINLIIGDIRDQQLLDDCFSNADYCFHLAALRITRCAENPVEATEVMINGTLNILNMCVKHKLKKLIFSSTASIYGSADEYPTEEKHHPYNNRTYYGAMKLTNESMCRSYHDMYGLNYLALRYFNIYGPRMDTEGRYTEVMIRWIKSIQEGKAPTIFGDGKQSMDFVFVKDVANANILALTSSLTNDVFNVASGKETSLCELADLLLTAMQSILKPVFIPLPSERNKVEVTRRMASIKKAEELLKFNSSISLLDGLKQLISWTKHDC
ncbi:MAG: NAD-dependent epimerase/dehydratase family protein, partial [Oligoflexia bacterium]|nr:NAD-dependent epimerase/dehydratase family protein [Oligoflexia bacterium]